MHCKLVIVSTRCGSDNCRASSCGKWHGIRQQLAREPILTIGYTCCMQSSGGAKHANISHRSSASLSFLTAGLLINITLFYNSPLHLVTTTHSQSPRVSIRFEKIRCLRKKVHFWAPGRAQQPLRQTTPHRH
jgi:hypothetical protein